MLGYLHNREETAKLFAPDGYSLSRGPGCRGVAMPDERLGEAVCLYLVAAPGYGDITLEKIKTYLLEQGVAIQKVPERLEIVEALPTTATGKIQKNVLREQIAAKIAADRERAQAVS